MMSNATQHWSWILGRRGRAAGAALALTIVVGMAAAAAPLVLAQTFEAPGAGTGAMQGTIGVSINTAGVVTGIYYDASYVAHGFVRAANGTITDFDAPNAGGVLNQGTFQTSINTAGTVAGMYSDSSNLYHGFVRAANGTITQFDSAGSSRIGKFRHCGSGPEVISCYFCP
jgi:hypothetical protein